MALYQKVVLVRPNSSADFETAMNFAKDWMMNNFQETDENKDENGDYIDYFFAQVVFAKGHATNDGQVWLIFTPPCEQKYNMLPEASGRIEYQVADLSGTRVRLDALERFEESAKSELGDHENRIVALENAGDDGVEATVI